MYGKERGRGYMKVPERRLSRKLVAVLVLAAWIYPLAALALSGGGAAAASDVSTSLSSGGKPGDSAPEIDLTGKRDPFRPYVESLGATFPRGKITPLQQYELSQLRVVAIITEEHNGGESRAMVEDSTGLGYILRVGTPIGRERGRVTAIESDRVVVEEWPSDVFGEHRRAVIVKELDAGEEANR